uniref:Uncharacterized protein n=1 Tax=Yersinia enterocolitica W22703 TaxID=913028 RepID=F4N4U9_YEREN|nr:unknown protein [Yersinia enterocolitica W22703]
MADNETDPATILCPSSFKIQGCWLPSLTQLIELSQLLGFIPLPPTCNLKSIGCRND